MIDGVQNIPHFSQSWEDQTGGRKILLISMSWLNWQRYGIFSLILYHLPRLYTVHTWCLILRKHNLLLAGNDGLGDTGVSGETASGPRLRVNEQYWVYNRLAQLHGVYSLRLRSLLELWLLVIVAKLNPSFFALSMQTLEKEWICIRMEHCWTPAPKGQFFFSKALVG